MGTLLLLAEVGGGTNPVAGLTFIQILILIIVIAACVAIVYVALLAMGVQLPQWFVTIILICCVAVVAVLAVKFIASLW